MSDELLAIVDINGRQIGYATRGECHKDPVLIHPVVHFHVFDSKGRLFLQKRAGTKELYPGYWDTSVGGHISYNEDVSEALKRESKEELGIDITDPIFLFNYIWKNKDETEYVHAFKLIYSGNITLHPEEIEEGQFFTFDEIRILITKGKTTPNFTYEFKLLS